MTDDKLHAATVRAARAQALLDDALLREAFDALDADDVRAWRLTDARDDDARQRLWQAVNVLAKVRDPLRQAVSDGHLAQKEIDALAAREKRGRLFGRA
jgi:hypothetical protein